MPATEQTATHTPGPWELVEGPPGAIHRRHRVITMNPAWTVYAADPHFPDQAVVIASYTFTEANARLIAAAPELLEACEAAYGCFRGIEPNAPTDGPRWQAFLLLRAAFHKATI